MADARDAGDAGASSSQPSTVLVEDFQRLSDRMTAQERQIVDFIAYMSAQMNTLISHAHVTTNTTIPSPTPETPVVPVTAPITAEARIPVPPVVPTTESPVDTPIPTISHITGLTGDTKLTYTDQGTWPR
ncbi:hypothetical protein Syun_013568 [Stephania yunnanensis]|uniref:Uncharacterized protein n=1 Tax=Stephania yunnanensis TaxID=152371 RepID=A0AAP0JJE2_9MAGN